MPLTVIRDRYAVGPNVAAEFDYRLQELALLEPGPLEVQVELEAIDRFQCTIDVAMPQEPLQPLQFVEHCLRQDGVITGTQAFGELAHDRDPHRDVEPIEVLDRKSTRLNSS